MDEPGLIWTRGRGPVVAWTVLGILVGTSALAVLALTRLRPAGARRRAVWRRHGAPALLGRGAGSVFDTNVGPVGS